MVGQSISHYKILDELGRGGMGIVYKAEDENLGRAVALKVLPPQTMAGEVERARFFREARSAAALNHPHIATIYQVDEFDGAPFIAMEFVDGESLEMRIEKGPLPIDEAIRLCTEIGAALDAAHEAGIVHRDIKSANVMLTKKSEAKVLDFGLAKTDGATAITQEGNTVGTIAYMSPEQAQGTNVDKRSDLFSLGVILYEMVTGQRPFQGAYDSAIIYSIMNVNPEPMTALRTGVPMELERITYKLLAKETDARYQSATDLIVDLQNLAKASEKASSSTVSTAAPAKESTERAMTPTRFSQKTAFSAATTVVLIGLVLVWKFLLMGTSTRTEIDSIAVLPMVNMTGDAANEFITDGMTEALINELGRIQALSRVISFTSVRPYKDARKPLSEIGDELGIAAVIESSLKSSGTAVHVDVRLINAHSEERLWEQSYQRAMSDVPALQREVALAVSQELEVALSPSETSRLSDTQSVNPDAHKAYLQGRFFFNKWTEEGFEKALEYFQTALQIDSTYALGFAGLSDTYNLLGNLGFRAQEEVSPLAKSTALKALELDETLAEAHLSLSSIWLTWEWNFDEGERELARALELNPNYVLAHQWRTEMLAFKGQYQTALEACRRALELDPLSVSLTYDYGWISYWAGDYDQAREYIGKAIELDPNNPGPYFFLSLSYHKLGMNDEAIGAHIEYVERRGFGPEVTGNIRNIFRAEGIPGVWNWELQNLERLAADGYVDPGHLAWHNALTGNIDAAFEWLEKAYSAKSITVLTMKGDPIWNDFRDDTRYLNIVARVGLPE